MRIRLCRVENEMFTSEYTKEECIVLYSIK